MHPSLTQRLDRGFSLLEVMVAVVVLSIAVVGLFRVFDQGALALGSDQDRLLAGIIARNRAEEIQLGLSDLPDTVEMAKRIWAVEVTSRATRNGFEQVEIRVTSEAGRAGARVTAYRKAGGRL